MMSDTQLIALMAATLEAGDRTSPEGSIGSPMRYVQRAHDLLLSASWYNTEKPIAINNARPFAHRPESEDERRERLVREANGEEEG